MLQQYLDDFAVNTGTKASRCAFVFLESISLLLSRLAADFDVDVRVEEGAENMLHYLPIVLEGGKEEEGEEREVVDTWFLQEKADFDFLHLVPSQPSSKV